MHCFLPSISDRPYPTRPGPCCWTQGARPGHRLVPPQRQCHRLCLRGLHRQSVADTRERAYQVGTKNCLFYKVPVKYFHLSMLFKVYII